MAVKEILRMGDPRLQQVSEVVNNVLSDELKQLIEDMFDTMKAYQGAGLAAPQIGVQKRVVIFGVENNDRYPDADSVPLTVLINPEIEVLSVDKRGYWEGCLSIPGMRGYVERPAHIRYRGLDADGNQIEREVTGFHAIVVQHECDHLDGVLYPMRMEDMSKFGFVEELAKK
ncbi:peptide deformylase [Aliikangiella sp. IMCC44359]|uniref:peptide deformylase n=1 Tax=Aliikangiella sp. IMCC44359 TaxID=3459125 RepID=UPI00403B1DA9